MIRHVLPLGLLALAACTGPEAPSSAPSKRSAMSSAARWVPVRLADPKSTALPARVVADPHGAAEVTALFSGQVRSVAVQPGDRVDEGATLAEVSAPELAVAVAEFGAARRQLELLRARRSALAGLRKQGLARQSEVFELEARIAELEAQESLAGAQLRSRGLGAAERRGLAGAGRVVLRSPVAGVVTDVHVHVGQTVSADGHPLVQVQGQGSARVEVQLPAPLPEVAQVALRGHDGRRYPLRTPAVATVVDPETGTLRAWFELADARLPSGLRGQVEVSATKGSWFEVPSRAVVGRGDEAKVYRRREQSASWVSVRVQTGSGASVTVQGELQTEDEVLADGRAAPADTELR